MLNATSLLAITLAVVSGLMVTLQPALNAQLAHKLGAPLKAAFVSFSAGTLVLALMLVLTRATPPSAQQISATPWYLWVAGGSLGAFFVTSAAWATPKVGVAAYLSVLVAAQLTAALTLDHLGVLGLEQRLATPERALGVGLLLAGAVLVTRG